MIRVGIVTAPHIRYALREQTFVLHNVRIGIGFHWDRCEEQEFEGQLEIRPNRDGTETAINTIDIEDYLTSVISSEMSADCPLELLKAHAVIARSWASVAADPRKRKGNLSAAGHEWYDICADDHCQRYEGIRRRKAPAIEAVQATRGQVLTYGGEICDCRYHKCCGGRTEVFETCWDVEDGRTYPYLQRVECPYCGRAVGRKDILRTILNDYDQETEDFHDWTTTYVNKDIQALIPLKRGVSGRIYELKIVYQDGHEETIGKELTIRKRLSDTCLYSSWLDVKKQEDGIFELQGHGWGHGVGLCQIGAAVMATEGATYEQILQYYYKGARLTTMN